jgi:hypothetical protein
MRYARIAGIIAALGVAAGCNPAQSGPALGTEDSVIVIALDSLWAAVGDQVQSALEPRIFTVREEKTFELTQGSPVEETWLDLRRFRNVITIGSAGDAWVEPVLGGGGEGVEPPAVVERRNVWARGQLVTALVLPAGGGGEAVSGLLNQVGDSLDARFRRFALSRMFMSGADSALADTLWNERGYSLLLPQIYDRTVYDDADVFTSVSQVQGVLVRTIFVGWRPGIVENPTVAMALAFRDSASAREYEPQHRVQPDRIEARTVPTSGREAFEVQGVWSSRDDSWPAAGPFIVRIIPCHAQDRTYFIDAWVYAPGREKYEYMIQLHTLLDTFRCGGRSAGSPAGAGS